MPRVYVKDEQKNNFKFFLGRYAIISEIFFSFLESLGELI
jgi:hypothetical protein